MSAFVIFGDKDYASKSIEIDVSQAANIQLDPIPKVEQAKQTSKRAPQKDYKQQPYI